MLNKIKKSSNDTIQLASRSLQNGEVIVMPTDTVYGLTALAEDESAVKKIFKIKVIGQDNFNRIYVEFL